ncbi:twin-arginine translocation signal domain-containing protein [Halomonas sp. MCCC 1A11062]|nr:twin-arginine translocation signal domain-containing protein [Halomonas sp. MCCC 1A11062]
MNRRSFLKAMGVTSVAAGGFGTAYAMRSNPYYQGPVSDHFDGLRFFNPGGAEPPGVLDLARWQVTSSASPWPEAWPQKTTSTLPIERVSGDDLRATMVGHATILIQVAGVNILTDPVYSRRTSPVSFAGPQRVNEPGIRFEDLPPIDLVLVTHSHYDHLDLATLERLHAIHDPLVITPLGNDTIILNAIPAMRVHAQDWGDVTEWGPVAIHCEPAHHWSARSLWDRRMALWASFVVETPAGNIYHVGDTGFHSGINYRAAREKHGGFRLANLPIGAYEPRWFMQSQHQNPEEAVQGMMLCGARNAIGHHWGSFQLTDEAVEQPRQDLHAALSRAAISQERFRALLPGDAWEVPADRLRDSLGQSMLFR